MSNCDMTICKESPDRNHNLLVTNYKFKAEHRHATQLLCSKCFRLFNFADIAARHADLNREEKDANA